MIVVYHKGNKVTSVFDVKLKAPLNNQLENPIQALFDIADTYPDRILVWCHDSFQESLNLDGITNAFKLKNMMLSYSDSQYLSEQIGYVEDSPFLKVNKKVKYPTWMVSSLVGAIYASQLKKFQNQINKDEDFDFSLNSIAKLGIAKGMYCYSEPKLLSGSIFNKQEKASTYKLFKFVKQHYKPIWSYLLLINIIINDREFPIISFLRTLLIKKIRSELKFDFETLNKLSIKDKPTIDVLVPTLGRKEHVYNFLKDLSHQIYLPSTVIIIEQNENENSISELDFILKETWPFKIIHKFIHKTGACNARNIGLSLVTSDYVFLADDDIRINSDFISSVMLTIINFQLNAVTLSCLGKNDVKTLKTPMQWVAFGSGCSIVLTERLEGIRFNMQFEFGYGEDIDFGMQLRNTGTDIIYLPLPEIRHLKAPIGGFRTKFVHPWEKDVLQPKPAPTVMLNRIQNSTKKQLLGYRTALFFNYYSRQSIKNPLKYYKVFKKQWAQSLFWEKQLKEKSKS